MNMPLGNFLPKKDIANRIIFREVDVRSSRVSTGPKKRAARLRLTRRQRDFLREGARELQTYFQDPMLWEQAAVEAQQAQDELGIPNLVPGFTMWTSSVAALAHGSWWLLMPGCGAPELRTSVCQSLEKPFLERREEYAKLAEALANGKYPLIQSILERTERIRCMLAMHVREGHGPDKRVK